MGRKRQGKKKEKRGTGKKKGQEKKRVYSNLSRLCALENVLFLTSFSRRCPQFALEPHFFFLRSRSALPLPTRLGGLLLGIFSFSFFGPSAAFPTILTTPTRTRPRTSLVPFFLLYNPQAYPTREKRTAAIAAARIAQLVIGLEQKKKVDVVGTGLKCL